jgi:hypothetical protein
MKTDVRFCSYVAQFLFKMRNVPEKFVERIMFNNAQSPPPPERKKKKYLPFMR